jgi:hypothetical protein
MLTKACGETIRLSACLSTEQVSMKQEAQKLQLWVAHQALTASVGSSGTHTGAITAPMIPVCW